MAMRIDGVLAPAKLNLFLHVTGVRDDGYHLLQSVFVRIGWYDTLDFVLRSDSTAITREDVTTPLPPIDLTVQAAQALQQASGTPFGVHMRVAKTIPAEAGMGGGSSDAASVLLTLNRLWGLHWPVERLLPIATQLGADVPFFVAGRNAWVEGIGEQITPLTGPLALPPAQFVVIKPLRGVATAEIFRHPLLNRKTARATITGFGARPFQFGWNDLQPVAEALCPDVRAALSLLEGAGFQGRMTGSGSAVFAVIGPADCRQQCELKLRSLRAALPPNWLLRVCDLLP